MALDAKRAAALALHRFGLGPRAGSIAAIASDPRGALLAELEKPGAGQIVNSELLTGAAIDDALHSTSARSGRPSASRRASARSERKRTAAGQSMESRSRTSRHGGGASRKRHAEPNVPQQIFFREVKARIDAALRAEIGFVERLVWFWSNHFCVSADRS